MIEYKILCSNFPPDGSDLKRFAQENWEFVGICTIDHTKPMDEHLPKKPAGMIESGEKVRYVWYFKRII